MTRPLTQASEAHLATCATDLQRLVRAVAAKIDVCVAVGHRDQAAQDAAFAAGKSKLPWPKSRHNTLPSEAVDLCPLQPDGTIDWSDAGKAAFRSMAAVVKQTALELGIAIEWGGDWTGTLGDLDHFQLARPPA